MNQSTIDAATNNRERAQTREASLTLKALLSEQTAQSESFTLSIENIAKTHTVLKLPVPMSALHLMAQLLTLMAQGKDVALMAVDHEISTFEAADMLNVSRPYLIKLLEAGAIPFRRVGTHRRVILRDLLEYKREDDAKREAILGDLAAEAQAMDMGY